MLAVRRWPDAGSSSGAQSTEYVHDRVRRPVHAHARTRACSVGHVILYYLHSWALASSVYGTRTSCSYLGPGTSNLVRMHLEQAPNEDLVHSTVLQLYTHVQLTLHLLHATSLVLRWRSAYKANHSSPPP